jgi:hypothetical protein
MNSKREPIATVARTLLVWPFYDCIATGASALLLDQPQWRSEDRRHASGSERLRRKRDNSLRTKGCLIDLGQSWSARRKGAR